MSDKPNAGDEYRPIPGMIELYYPNDHIGQEMAAVVRGLSGRVKLQPFGKDGFTPTIWEILLDKLDVSPHDLFDQEAPYYLEHIEGHDFDREAWLEILMKHWDILEVGILVKGPKAWICRTPYEISNFITDDPIDDNS